MAADSLLVDERDAVTWLTLNRPDRLNALDAGMIEGLLEVLPRLDADPGVRVIVLTGAGRGFCAGADVGDLAAAADDGVSGLRPPALRQRLRHGSVRLAKALLDLETPVVAAVNGACAGAGFGIALSADFLVARSDAVFSVAFVRRGLVPDYATTFLLPRISGLGVARRLCLLGDVVPAREASGMGFVHEVVDADGFAQAVAALAGRLAAGAAAAQGLTKRLLADAFEVDGALAVDREFSAQALCLSSADAAEGARAFLEKREPRFTGR